MPLTREASAGYLTNWAARLFTRELERQLLPHAIATAYMPVLFALADGTTMTPKQLAQRAAVEQPTMTATLQRMERDGFLTRQANPDDGRSALVRLTPLALGKITVVEDVVNTINTLAIGHLDQQEQRQFMTLMRRVITVLESQEAERGGTS